MATFLKNLNIQNYRSHTDTRIYSTNNVHVIVGKNDIGKSSILKALNELVFAQNDLHSDDVRVSNPTLSAGDVKIHIEMETSSVTQIDISYGSDNKPNFNVNPSTVSASQYLSQFKFEIFPAENFYDSSLEGKTVRQLFADTIATLPNNPVSKSIENSWKDILGGCLNSPIHIEKHGTGVRRLCSLFKKLIESLTTMSGTQQYLIFAIEEPEISLHPNQQRALIQNLTLFSTGLDDVQFVITSHSPYIVRQLKENNISILSYIDNVVCVNRMAKRCLKYFSLNEINYLAFDEPSAEYHQELFGMIEGEYFGVSNGTRITKIIKDLKDKGLLVYDSETQWIDNERLLDNCNFDSCDGSPAQNVSLCYCVRNALDHPFAGNKKWVTDEYIKKSIKIMIWLISILRNLKCRFLVLARQRISELDNYGFLNLECIVDDALQIHSSVHWVYYKLFNMEKQIIRTGKDIIKEQNKSLNFYYDGSWSNYSNIYNAYFHLSGNISISII